MAHILFAKTFPKTHPKAGQPTGFANAILEHRKIHTIRKGHRWKVGDMIVFRQWSGAPYRSPQESLANGCTPVDSILGDVRAVYSLIRRENGIWSMWPGNAEFELGPEVLHLSESGGILREIARNDGLSIEDFVAWFPKEFDGQIICWRDDPYKHLFVSHE